MTDTRIPNWLMIAALALATAASSVNAAKPVSAGLKAPAFSVQLFDGTKKTLADYQGKVLVLNYWATWCVPCKAEMPMMSSFHKRNKTRGFEIIGIVTRDSVSPNMLKRVEAALSYPLAKNLKGKYGVIGNAVPTSYVLDRKGIVRYAQAGRFEAEEFKKIIDPLLDE
jgi:cytochrome c biogenesis protein CcmG, thiol:disulfide interchange protein DsbE